MYVDAVSTPQHIKRTMSDATRRQATVGDRSCSHTTSVRPGRGNRIRRYWFVSHRTNSFQLMSPEWAFPLTVLEHLSNLTLRIADRLRVAIVESFEQGKDDVVRVRPLQPLKIRSIWFLLE